VAIVLDEKRGPIRVVIEAQRGALVLFTAKDRNTAIRASLQSGGEYWRAGFLPMRFSSYAANALGYRVSQKWEKAKQRYLGEAIPFVGFGPSNGGNPPTWSRGDNTVAMRDVALAQSRVEATATASRQRILIFIPFGHPVQDQTSVYFRVMPTFEVEAIAREVARTLASIISSGVMSTAKGARAPRTLTGASTPVASRPSAGGRARKVA